MIPIWQHQLGRKPRTPAVLRYDSSLIKAARAVSAIRRTVSFILSKLLNVAWRLNCAMPKGGKRLALFADYFMNFLSLSEIFTKKAVSENYYG